MLAKLFTCSCWWENVEQQFYRGLTDWKYSLKANQYPERRWSTWARRSYYKATVALLTNPIVPWLICWEWRCDKCLKEHWDTAVEDCQAIWLVFCCFFFFHSTKFRSRQVTALEVGRSCSYTQVATESAGLCMWLAGTIRSAWLRNTDHALLLSQKNSFKTHAFCI